MPYSVDVVGGRYRMRGEFHSIEPNQPIRNEEGKLCGVTNPRRLVHTHSYGGEHEFFDGIARAACSALAVTMPIARSVTSPCSSPSGSTARIVCKGRPLWI